MSGLYDQAQPAGHRFALGIDRQLVLRRGQHHTQFAVQGIAQDCRFAGVGRIHQFPAAAPVPVGQIEAIAAAQSLKYQSLAGTQGV